MTPGKAIKMLEARVHWLTKQVDRGMLPEQDLSFKRAEIGAVKYALKVLDAARGRAIDPGMTSKMDVTSGGPLGSFFHTTAPTMRCELIGVSTPGVVTLDWAYFGPSTEPGTLDSGILRRQIGLKLRSADPCNLLYVMREVDPEHRIFVQAKMNPGMKTSDECGSNGYINLGDTPVDPAVLGKLSATFRTVIGVEQLEVRENGKLMLSIAIDGPLSKLKGHYGVRSDSGRFVFKITPS